MHYNISVVIPNYNGKHLLETNLPSVYKALKFIKMSYEIIVVDDASTDDSTTFLKQNYPDVKLLVNEKNKGFSPTINRGIFSAQNKLVLALNSDVGLTKEYFVEQLKYFELPDTFGVMGKIKDIDSDRIQDGAKYPIVTFKGIKATRNYLPKNASENKWLPSFFLSGANALMDREKFIQLGGFDELYAPFYYEDSDLGIRAWRVGWKCYFEPRAICTHETSSTISKLKPEKVRIIIERNKILFNQLHLNGIRLFVFNFWLFLRCIAPLMIGKTSVYKAMRLLKESQLKLQQARKNLSLLQTKNGVSYSVKEIEQEIVSNLKKIDIDFF